MDYHPGNRSKQLQEAQTITTGKFECKALVMCEAMHAVFQANFAMDIVSFLELFGLISGAIIPITQSLLLQIVPNDCSKSKGTII